VSVIGQRCCPCEVNGTLTNPGFATNVDHVTNTDVGEAEEV
jgi:hypothetical protein